MANWLLKTEPGTYSWADLVKDRSTVWDGVSNNLALKHIRMMKKGDLVFIYHTGAEKAVVGIAEVTSDPFPDPAKADEKLVVFRLKPKEKLRRPVGLQEIKARTELASFPLVRLPRLSVMPVDRREWKTVLQMSSGT